MVQGEKNTKETIKAKIIFFSILSKQVQFFFNNFNVLKQT